MNNAGRAIVYLIGAYSIPTLPETLHQVGKPVAKGGIG